MAINGCCDERQRRRRREDEEEDDEKRKEEKVIKLESDRLVAACRGFQGKIGLLFLLFRKNQK